MVQSRESAEDIAEIRTDVAVLAQKNTTLEDTMDDVNANLSKLSEQVTGLVINYKVFRIIVGLALAAGPGIGVLLVKGFG